MNIDDIPRPNDNAVPTPTRAGKYWFNGISIRGLTTTRVQGRPLVVDDELTPRDPESGIAIESVLTGWWEEVKE